jgi:Na+-transporting methylmalonyl-CoA/oxaloacetate decarboxylase gamma subunit
MLRSVVLVITDVWNTFRASIIRMTSIGELRTLAVTGNRRTLHVNVVLSSLILVILMMEALSSSETRFLQEPHGVTSQKTAFFSLIPLT